MCRENPRSCRCSSSSSSSSTTIPAPSPSPSSCWPSPSSCCCCSICCRLGREDAMRPDRPSERRAAASLRDPTWLRLLLTLVAVLFLLVFLVMPLAVLFSEALSDGFSAYVEAILDPDAL